MPSPGKQKSFMEPSKDEGTAEAHTRRDRQLKRRSAASLEKQGIFTEPSKDEVYLAHGDLGSL